MLMSFRLRVKQKTCIAPVFANCVLFFVSMASNETRKAYCIRLKAFFMSIFLNAYFTATIVFSAIMFFDITQKHSDLNLAGNSPKNFCQSFFCRNDVKTPNSNSYLSKLYEWSQMTSYCFWVTTWNDENFSDSQKVAQTTFFLSEDWNFPFCSNIAFTSNATGRFFAYY